MDPQELDIIQRAVGGDQTAYRMLYQVYEKAVRGRVSGYFHWKADVDDVAFLPAAPADSE